MRLGKPNKVIWYERPFLKTLRQYWAGQGWLGKENNIHCLSIRVRHSLSNRVHPTSLEPCSLRILYTAT